MPRGVPKAREQLVVDDAVQVSDPAVAVSAEDVTDAPASEPVEVSWEEPALFDVTDDADVVLSPEQLRIKELENQLALERGRKDVEPEVDEITSPAEGNIVIHFLEDGLTALGKIWYRGQELEFDTDSKAYKDTFDRRGRSWLELRDDERAQMKRWGKVMFRSGTWPGTSYQAAAKVGFLPVRDANGRPVAPPSEQELARLDAEAKKRRAAPKLPTG